jgi:acyl-CoA thioesterase-1
MDMRRYFSPRGIISTILAPAGAATLVLASCGGERARSAAPPPATSSPEATVASAVADDRPVVLFLGTSLTAGYGLDPAQAFPALVQQKMDAAGLRYRVVNAGVSGETSAGALRRIDWLLRQPVAVLVVETGANDGLRGQDPDATRANIQAIFDAAKRHEPKPRLVLAEMEALPNYGEDYARRFRAIYPQLARANGATLLPFLLEGVAGDARLNQGDGIHPTAEGEKRVAENVWKVLRPLLSVR